MESSVYNKKLMDLLDDNIYEQISSQTILKNGNDFNVLQEISLKTGQILFFIN